MQIQETQTQFNEALRDRQAYYKNDLKHFLIPHFSFRLHITFKNSQVPNGATKRHFYGNEHKCTLAQLRAGHVLTVTLDKYKGLQDLIELVERTWKGKWLSATIYMRTDPGGPFDSIVRKYYQGKLEDEQTPVLQEPVKRLHYFGINNFKPVLSYDKNPHQDLPDFKAELQKALA